MKVTDCLDIGSIAGALLNNKVVLIPTETVFGVAALFNETGSNALYEVKRRPHSKALPVLVNSYKMIKDICELSEFQLKAVKRLLPGPLTLVLKTKNKVNGLDTIALRYSSDLFLNKLVDAVNSPLYLTSANISGQEPIKSAIEATRIFKDEIEVYVEGKPNFNLASTIVDLTNDEIKILREGPISYDDIVKLLED